MIVVSDTSPICYLLLIGRIEILQELYQTIIIPEAVAAELNAAESPSMVRAWIAQPPNWLQIQSVEFAQTPQLENLDLGEREAIAIAENLNADLVILDDKAARQFAVGQGLKVIGLLGIIKDAASRDLLDLELTFEQLRRKGFWVKPELLNRLLEN
jgi:predicted nucleic acid-binding protein